MCTLRYVDKIDVNFWKEKNASNLYMTTLVNLNLTKKEMWSLERKVLHAKCGICHKTKIFKPESLSV